MLNLDFILSLFEMIYFFFFFFIIYYYIKISTKCIIDSFIKSGIYTGYFIKSYIIKFIKFIFTCFALFLKFII